MVLLDRGLAVAGRSAIAIEQRAGGSRRAPWAVVVGLVAMSAIPTFLIGISPRPTNLTWEDLRLNRIPAMTSWVRLEGDLERDPASESLYKLRDPLDDLTYVTVDAPAPLPTGHMIVTGRLSGAGGGTEYVGWLIADIPAVPPRDEPFHLILLPAALAGGLAIGIRVGYPVVRRERPSAPRADPLAPDLQLPARWSGWMGSDIARLAEMVPCTVAVTPGRDVCLVTVTDASRGARIIRVRPGSLAPVRLCRIGGDKAGLELHAPSADLLLAFDRRADRDRLAAALASSS